MMKNTAIDENRIIARVSAIGIGGNVVLSAFKLFAGITGKSGAMISDAVHSLSDVFATFIAFLGVRMSKKEADIEHPYGHERFECVAAIILSGILIATGIGIGLSGIEVIIAGGASDVEVPGILPLIAAVVSIATKEAMYWYTRAEAKRLNSSAFMADAWHHRSDAFSSVGALIGIGAARMGYPIMDSIASVVICVFILKAGIDIFREAVGKMTDRSCDKDKEEQFKRIISDTEGVVQVDRFHTRVFGNKVYVDADIKVDGSLSLNEAHEIAQRAHDRLEKIHPEIKHIMIHLDPDNK